MERTNEENMERTYGENIWREHMERTYGEKQREQQREKQGGYQYISTYTHVFVHSTVSKTPQTPQYAPHYNLPAASAPPAPSGAFLLVLAAPLPPPLLLPSLLSLK